MQLRFILFLTVLVAVLAAIDWLVARRVSAALGLSPRWRWGLAALLYAGLAAFLASRLVGRIGLGSIAVPLGVTGAAIQLGAVLAGAILAVERLLRRVLSWFRRESDPPAPPVDAGRRELLGGAAAGVALGVGGVSSGYAAFFGRHDYVVEEVPVRLPALPRALDGYTIVQLSDVHLGAFVGEPEIRAMIELVRRADPDLIVLTGDLIDHDPRYAELLGSMARRLSESAPVAAIPGNHDYYAGIEETLATLRRGGADVLVNEARLIGDGGGDIALVGIDDVWAQRVQRHRGPDIARAVRRLPDREVPRIALCHNPAYFPTAAPHVDLQLSGHTHGGQFNPGFRPAELVLPYGYVAGRYERDGAVLWVNRGFGTAGPPARLGAAPEITKVVLTV